MGPVINEHPDNRRLIVLKSIQKDDVIQNIFSKSSSQIINKIAGQSKAAERFSEVLI